MKKYPIALFVVSILFISVNAMAQSEEKVIGKVFTKEEANELFGPVKTAIKVKTSVLANQLSKTDERIMFSIKDDDLLVADSKRNLLSTNKISSLSADEVMHVYSKSVVEELLSKGKSEYIIFEMRAEKFTVTNGNYTMEMGQVCPPICW